MKTFYGLLSLMLLISCVEGEVMSNQVTVYYIPIGSDTYSPVTNKNIDDMYYKTLKTNDRDKSIIKIKKLLVGTQQGDLDNLKIRVKMTWAGNKDVVLIDDYGNFKINNGDTFKLSLQSLNKLSALFESITEKRKI